MEHNRQSQDANSLYLEPAVLNNDVVEMGGKSPNPRASRENGCARSAEVPVHAAALRQEVLFPVQPRQLQNCGRPSLPGRL